MPAINVAVMFVYFLTGLDDNIEKGFKCHKFIRNVSPP